MARGTVSMGPSTRNGADVLDLAYVLVSVALFVVVGAFGRALTRL